MKINHKKVDVSLEKRILIGFIVSTDFLKKIIKIYDKNYFSSHASRKIAKWSIDYFKQYEKAPNKHITDIYLQSKKKEDIEEQEQEFIDSILNSLSDEWENTENTFNTQTLIDQTVTFFNEKHVKLFKEEIDECLENNQPEKVEELVAAFKPLKLSDNAEYFNPLSDKEGMTTAINSRTEPLFKLPGALGRLMNSQLYKGGFIALQAPEKSGKSHILQEIVMRALRSKIKVAFFELGDLSKNDRYCRIGSYIAKKPFSRDKNEDGVLLCKVPELIDNDGEYSVQINEILYPVLTPEDAIAAGENWIRRCGSDCLRISVHSSDSTSINDINEILHVWKEEDDWEPDLIGIDYPDIAAKEKGVTDERSAVNARWKAQRRLSQDWNALVIAVTQADAGSYGKSAQGLKNFSEDKRKYSHVTAIYAINQTLQEKTQNITRLAPLLIREGDTNYSKHVAIVHCLDLGRPYMFSFEVDALKYMENDDDDDE